MTDYDPTRDLYEVLGLPPDAEEDEIRERLAELRVSEESTNLDEAAAVVLDLERRTRYDTQRAGYRLRRMMRASLPVFAGRASAPWDADGP